MHVQMTDAWILGAEGAALLRLFRRTSQRPIYIAWSHSAVRAGSKTALCTGK